MSEMERKMAAFSAAMSEMLASVMGEVIVIRALLDEREVFSDADYKRELQKFRVERWQSFADEVAEKVQQLAQHKLLQMPGGAKN